MDTDVIRSFLRQYNLEKRALAWSITDDLVKSNITSQDELREEKQYLFELLEKYHDTEGMRNIYVLALWLIVSKGILSDKDEDIAILKNLLRIKNRYLIWSEIVEGMHRAEKLDDRKLKQILYSLVNDPDVETKNFAWIKISGLVDKGIINRNEDRDKILDLISKLHYINNTVHKQIDYLIEKDVI
jgi:hypothetical protein